MFKLSTDLKSSGQYKHLGLQEQLRIQKYLTAIFLTERIWANYHSHWGKCQFSHTFKCFLQPIKFAFIFPGLSFVQLLLNTLPILSVIRKVKTLHCLGFLKKDFTCMMELQPKKYLFSSPSSFTCIHEHEG